MLDSRTFSKGPIRKHLFRVFSRSNTEYRTIHTHCNHTTVALSFFGAVAENRIILTDPSYSFFRRETTHSFYQHCVILRVRWAYEYAEYNTYRHAGRNDVDPIGGFDWLPKRGFRHDPYTLSHALDPVEAANFLILFDSSELSSGQTCVCLYERSPLCGGLAELTRWREVSLVDGVDPDYALFQGKKMSILTSLLATISGLPNHHLLFLVT